MTTDDLHSYLNSFINYERSLPADPRVFKLDRMRGLLDAVGNPQDKLRTVHVAGSKGKGSVCALAAEMFRQAGYRAGLYTSPHLDDVRERIRILEPGGAGFDGWIIEDSLRRTLSELRPQLEHWRDTKVYGRLSYFEVLTAAALHHFVREKVDVAVIETGLGGRLDATNCVTGRVGGITSIGLEHTAQLGNTLTAITQEKAAILKSGMTAVSAPQESEVMEMIQRHCRDKNIPLLIAGQDIQYERLTSGKIRIKTGQQVYECDLKLIGEHQMINGATAVGLYEQAVSAYGLRLDSEAVERAAAGVVWPGRFEIVSSSPGIVLDVAHTEQAARYLAQTLKDIFPGRPVTAIVGMLEDKDMSRFLTALGDDADEIILTRPDHPRAGFMNGVSQVPEPLRSRCRVTQTISEALAAAQAQADPARVLVVTGSVYTVAEARRQLMNQGVMKCISGKD